MANNGFSRKILGRIKTIIYNLLPTKYRFTKIYSTGSWGSDESVSGGGSTIEVTESIRRDMPILLEKYKINSMMDAPCGDFNWMRKLLNDAPPGMKYIGADIVSPLIESVKINESDNIKFIIANIIEDDLPEVDLVLCRDCFIHFSEDDIKKSINNFKKSGAKYLLTTSFSEINVYEDIVTGRWRQLNFQLPPFSFPKPLDIIQEQGSNGKFLGLWELNKI